MNLYVRFCAERESGSKTEVGVATAGPAAQGHKPGLSRELRAQHHGQAQPRLRAQQPRPEGQNAPHRLPASGRQSVAIGPSYGDIVSGDSAGEHGRRETGQVARVLEPAPVCQSASYQRHRARTGSVPSQLHSQLQ